MRRDLPIILGRRGQQALRIVQRDGLDGLLRRSLRYTTHKMGADDPELPLLSEDVADSSTLKLPSDGPSRSAGQPLALGWICTPPSEGSGGHTTMFRFVEAMESAGHRCVVYVYDHHKGDLRTHNDIVRSWWPHIRAEVRDVSDGLPQLDAYVATSWQTAHVLATRYTSPGRRFYLIQDFEPFFYARGTEYALAEDTYRFGFRPITVGHMVANVVREQIGIDCTVAEFGLDAGVYQLTDCGARRDVIFYTKPDTPRRGYLLGVAALERFHHAHPDVTIHTFGMRARGLRFPAHVHSHLPPLQLNKLYNHCIAGLVLSFTNVSLIPRELLAAGVIPVLNDSTYVRADLDNPFVAWSRPTPGALATALCDAVEQSADGSRPEKIAASVKLMGWSDAQQTLVDVIERACYVDGGAG